MNSFKPKSDRFPKLLFKYLNWENEHHREVIKDQSIFFSSPDFFNDPFDMWIPMRYDLLTTTELRAKYWLFLKKTKLGNYPYTNRDISRLIDNLFQSGLLSSDAQKENVIEKFKFYSRKFYGVFCLSANPKNKLMWSHYSNNHKGFIIGFNSKLLFHSVRGVFIGPVLYNKGSKMPIIKPEIDPSDDIPEIKMLYSKSNDWKYEKEYRIIKVLRDKESDSRNLDEAVVLNSDRIISFNGNSISKIIFGAKMPEEQKSEIFNAIQENENFKNVKFYEANLNDRYFKLNIVKYSTHS